MTKVTFVKSARKDITDGSGTVIAKKGQSYYWWKFRFGGKQVSKTQPSRSQLTQSDFLQQIWDIEDRLHALEYSEAIQEETEQIKDELQTLSDECQERLDNIPEQLQNGTAGETLTNRIEQLYDMISKIEDIDFDVTEEINADFNEEEAEDKPTLEDIADSNDGMKPLRNEYPEGEEEDEEYEYDVEEWNNTNKEELEAAITAWKVEKEEEFEDEKELKKEELMSEITTISYQGE